MNVKKNPCDPQAIEQLLADRLGDEEQLALEEHLGACPACRERLDGAAAEVSWWQRARSCLAATDPTAAGDASGQPQLGSETVDNRSLFGLEGYLVPTDDPRMLGRLGGYEIAGVIGCGGMGIVLKGLDAPLGRYVAIKVLSPQLAASAAARQRFAREAKAASSVVHDNVMAIHAVGEAGGLPYLVMPYVRGPSLEKRLERAGVLAVEEILRVGMQIAAGLAAAHAQGLVHRDIKPANILLEEGVERVKITDFGLARASDDASLTRSGVIVGTPQYMSPEQARGESIDQRSDLFSLGSVLYAMCTGRPPFRAETPYGVLRRIGEERSRPVREVNATIPGWLEQVIEKLHEKIPSNRFQSAAEVAALLEQCLAYLQQPSATPLPAALTRPGGTGHPAPVWGKVRIALGVLAALCVAVIALVLADWRRNLSSDPKDQSGLHGRSQAGGKGWKEQAILQGHAEPVLCLAFGSDRLATGDKGGTVKLWAVDTARERGNARLRHKGPVGSLTFGSDGKLLFSTGSTDKCAIVWNTDRDISKDGSGFKAPPDQHLRVPRPDGETWVQVDGAMVILQKWDLARGLKGDVPLTVTLKKGDRIVFLGGSITEAGTGETGYITVIKETLSSKHPELGIKIIPAGISGNKVPDLQRRVDRDVIAKKPTIVFIYIGINDVWHGQDDPAKGTPKDKFEAGLKEVVGKITNAGARVILCTPTLIGEKNDAGNRNDKKLDAYAAISRKVAKELKLPLCDLRKAFVSYLKEHNSENKDRGVLTTDAVHLNNAGNKLVAETMLKMLLGDFPRELTRFVMNNQGRILSVALSRDGKVLATAGEGKTVRVWGVPVRPDVQGPGFMWCDLKGHTEPVVSVALSADGKKAACVGRDGALRLWDVPAEKGLGTPNERGVRCAAFSPDGKFVAVGGDGTVVRIWDLANSREAASLKGHKGAVRCLAFSPDGALLASGSDDKTVRIWHSPAK